MTDAPPQLWEQTQLELALGSIRFYARRALSLGASEDDVYDQAVKAVEDVAAQPSTGSAEPE